MLGRQQQLAYNFHNDESLHDQTPEALSFLEGLPSDAAAIVQYLVNGRGVWKLLALSQLALLPMFWKLIFS